MGRRMPATSQGRRLTGTVRSDKADDFARRDRERDAGHGRSCAVDLAVIFHVDGHAAPSPPAFRFRRNILAASGQRDRRTEKPDGAGGPARGDSYAEEPISSS